MNKFKSGFSSDKVTVGDKYLMGKNVEDITTYSVFIIDDIYELSSGENAYECSKYDFNYRGKITQFQN